MKRTLCLIVLIIALPVYAGGLSARALRKILLPQHISVQEPSFDPSGVATPRSIQGAMLDAFDHQAKRYGLTIDPSGIPITVTVTKWHHRNGSLRFALGCAAGPDILTGKVAFQSQSEELSQWSCEAWKSGAHLAEAFGQALAVRIADALAQQPTPKHVGGSQPQTATP